jgi:ribonuclease J
VNFKDYKQDMLFVPLGGSNEIGINVNLYHYQGKWLMVDCGSGFADDYLPGVDMVVADIDFILERKKDLIGIILTHAHEDHIGALQYFAAELGCPIYATRFTANFLKIRFSENAVKSTKIIEVSAQSRLNLDPFEIEMVGITHSAPEMQGMLIKCGDKKVLHTGDWKFDDDPVVGPATSVELLKKFGNEGIDALVCDSTNVFNEKSSGSEGDLRKSLIDIISGCKDLVVVTTFASNLARMDTLIHAGIKSGRKVVLSGRSMHRMLRAAQESGYLDDIGAIIDEKDIGRFKRSEVLVIATGCQGEPLASVAKMASGVHNFIRLAKGDTVIFSSKIIPGNEKKIFRMFNHFVRSGIEVITERDHFVHVSGHPGLEELKKMYELTKPLSVIPVHGEAAHLHEHAKFARKCGISTAPEVENGSVVLISGTHSAVIGKVDTGYLAVDGNSLLPSDSQIFKYRRRMKESGIVVVTILFDKMSKLIKKPILDFPGCLDSKEDTDIIEDIRSEMIVLLSTMPDKIKRQKSDEIEQTIRSLIRRRLKAEIGKTPQIIANIGFSK